MSGVERCQTKNARVTTVRPPLVRELVEIGMEYRRHRGESPKLDHYRKRGDRDRKSVRHAGQLG